MPTLKAYSIAYGCVTATVLSIAIFVLLSDARSKLNRVFSLYCVAIAIWTFFSLLGINTVDSDIAIWWFRLVAIGPIWIPSLFIHFVTIFTGKEEQCRRLIKVGYSISLFFFFCNMTPYFVADTVPKFSLKNFTVPGIFYHIHLAHFLCSVIFAHILIYRYYLQQQEDLYKQKQAYYLFWSALLGYAGGAPHYLPVYNIEIPLLLPYGCYLIVFYTWVIFYIISRYQFLNIKIVLKRTFVFAGLITAAFLLFGITTYLLNTKIGTFFHINQNIATIISIVIIAISSDPIYRFLQNKTDRYLFQKKYAYQKILNEASHGMARITDLGALLKLIHSFLTDKMRIKYAAIYLADNSKNKYSLRAGENGTVTPHFLDKSDPLIKCLKKGQVSLISEGLPHLSTSLDRGFSNQKSIEALLSPYNAVVAIPSISQNTLVAIFLLGEKCSGDHYNRVDIDTIEALASEAAIALENTRLYDHLQRSYENLKAAHKQLVQSEKMASLGQLAAGVAHEVNNPLTIIGGQAKLRLKELKGQKGPLVDFLHEAIKQSDRAGTITQKLLKFSKPTKGELQSIALPSFIKETLELVKQQTGTKHIKIYQEYSPKNISICAQRPQIQEVFVNILLNACQAMPLGGQIHIKGVRNGGQVEISIKDTGSGISQDKLSKIFDPFFTTKSGGTGLGLFLSYQIIKQHGGELEVQSKSGRGTTFTLKLPLATKS